ncbi:MAG: carbohydrate binding domain-containing protein [Candidatus Paceibacterota bacterium]|jgi:prepilin-type N-terminal cleavage/methylation domain-containing protein
MNKKIKSFTLIELLVVIAIVGILSGLIVISMNNAANSANDAKKKQDIDSLQKVILFNHARPDVFPIQTTECEIGNNCTTLQSSIIPEYFPTLSSIPRGPSGEYYKYQSTDGHDFTIKSTLFNGYTYQYQYNYGFSENHVTNGDFETGTMTGWTSVPGDGTIVADSVFKKSGTYSTKLEYPGSGNIPYITQYINLDNVSTISFYSYVWYGGKCYIDSTLHGVPPSSTFGDWILNTIDVNSLTGWHTIKFTLQTMPFAGNGWYDEIKTNP